MIRTYWTAAVALLASACGADAQTLDGAATAYRENRVAAAEGILKRLTDDPATTLADRARAWRATARIAWHVNADLPRALEAVRQAEATGQDRCENGQMLARLLEQSGRGQQLLADAEAMAGRCDEPVGADGIRLHAAAAALDLAAQGQAGAVDAAARSMALLSEDGRSGLWGASLALELGLLQGDAARALQAWRDYFWLRQTDLPQGIEARSGSGGETFARGLAADAAVEARLQLLDLLVRGGFAQAAERFAKAHRLAEQAAGHPLWRRAAAYFEARRELEAELLAANRRQARGGAAGDVEGAYNRALDRLARAADGGGDRAEVLRSAYGLHGQFGQTDGYPSVHLGHVAQHERRVVEQYGHRAEVSFIALDNMLANGFQTWLWDGDAATGGWAAEGGVIVQVRPEWTSSPLRGWNLVNGGPARAKLLERQKERAQDDLKAVAEGPATMNGMAQRLRLQAADQIMARVRGPGVPPNELRRAFLEEYWRASFQESILAHEGRHAIDKTLVQGIARLDDANLKYRAKLSQLALAEYPRLGLSNIVSEVGAGAHGKANARLVGEMAQWVDAHRGEVVGFDPALPAMVQLDRLSDEQLRTIARSLDPIAR